MATAAMQQNSVIHTAASTTLIVPPSIPPTRYIAMEFGAPGCVFGEPTSDRDQETLVARSDRYAEHLLTVCHLNEELLACDHAPIIA